jgi:hypothetical protein
MAGDCLQVPGSGNTHLKMLKTKRLQTFLEGSELPGFRQAANWRKKETVWVKGSTEVLEP